MRLVKKLACCWPEGFIGSNHTSDNARNSPMQHTNNYIDARQVKSFPLFSLLDDKSANGLGKEARVVNLAKGEQLLNRGQSLDGLYAVADGKMKIYLLSCNGAERVIRLLLPGDTFGEAIMFNSIPSPVFVQALSESRLLFFPKESVYELLAQRPQFTMSMLNSLSQLMTRLIGDLEICCMQNARQRLAHYLVTETRCSTELPPSLRLPASKAIVASTLNLSAETFSRELHRMAKEGLVIVDRRTISLKDLPSLRELAQRGDVGKLAQ